MDRDFCHRNDADGRYPGEHRRLARHPGASRRCHGHSARSHVELGDDALAEPQTTRTKSCQHLMNDPAAAVSLPGRINRTKAA